MRCVKLGWEWRNAPADLRGAFYWGKDRSSLFDEGFFNHEITWLACIAFFEAEAL